MESEKMSKTQAGVPSLNREEKKAFDGTERFNLMKILFIKAAKIDKEKYDQCILNARYGTIYAMSWYLDAVAPGWQLLATPDYSVVMPLPRKKKFGIPYILQPLMCQQLGIFSPEEITEAIYKQFIKKIPAVYCVLQLNTGNVFGQKKLRPNYVLDIRSEYPAIFSRYHSNTRNDLKKIAKTALAFDNVTEYTAVIELVRQQSPHYTGKLFQAALQVAEKASEKGLLLVRCVRNQATSELLAGVLFCQWQNRIYYLLPVSTPDGKKVRAMRFLVDRCIAEWAGKTDYLDFEGSAAPSVAQFYRNFGAVAEYYCEFKIYSYLCALKQAIRE